MRKNQRTSKVFCRSPPVPAQTKAFGIVRYQREYAKKIGSHPSFERHLPIFLAYFLSGSPAKEINEFPPAKPRADRSTQYKPNPFAAKAKRLYDRASGFKINESLPRTQYVKRIVCFLEYHIPQLRMTIEVTRFSGDGKRRFSGFFQGFLVLNEVRQDKIR